MLKQDDILYVNLTDLKILHTALIFNRMLATSFKKRKI